MSEGGKVKKSDEKMLLREGEKGGRTRRKRRGLSGTEAEPHAADGGGGGGGRTETGVTQALEKIRENFPKWT
jgi:hypothetical protein